MENSSVKNLDLKVLCVDDELAILEIYQDLVLQAGFTPILMQDPTAAIDAFKTDLSSIVMVISDYRMPQMNGFELRAALMAAGGAMVPFVIVSGFIDKDMALTALDLRISSFIDKPAGEQDFCERIAKEATPRVEVIREGQALAGIFVEEGLSILDEMEPVLLSLEHDRTNAEAINAIFRGAHTLKGSSGCLDSDVITRYVHKYEDIISGLKKSQITLTDEIYEILLKGFDRIKGLVASVATKSLHTYNLNEILPELSLNSGSSGTDAAKPGERAAVSPAGAAKGDAHKTKAKDSIAVPINMLDELSGYSGEITVIRNMVNKIVRSLEAQYVGNREFTSLGELLDEMHKINSTIQVRITDLRKVPLAAVFKPIPRTIRDLSRDLGKSIVLGIEGEALRVDNSLAAVCSNSLVHLVRNSADHGVELPAERLAAGKPESGSVHIKCFEANDHVNISIADDGRGIDYLKIKAKALEKGLFTADQLASMNEQQALGIIFASGFSTAAKVTDVSGRGVGMDMVKSSVEAVGGQINIESKPGHGSTFTLRLPIPKSVLIINSLVVESAKHCFAVPQDSILRVLRIEHEQYHQMVQNAATGIVLRRDDTIYPLVDLKDVLQLPSPPLDAAPATGIVEILILRAGALLFALRVDGILDSEEIVVKRLQSCFNPENVYAGATFMGDGSVGLILDVVGLAVLAGVTPSASEQAVMAHESQQSKIDQEIPIVTRDYLLFSFGAKTLFGAPLDQVFRLEELDPKKVQMSGAKRVIIYRDCAMPIYSIEKLLKLAAPDNGTKDLAKERIAVIVARNNEGYVGFEVSKVIDIASSGEKVSDAIRDRIGVAGNAFINERSVTILDLPAVLKYSMTSESVA